jgi:uncharacterized protein (TIGR02145 family)
MKRIALYLGITTALVVSCSIQEENFESPTQKDDVIFYASFEQPSEETRVYVNEDLHLRWTEDDRVSIFNQNTYNQQYMFLGETGDNAGGFNEVSGASFVSGNVISHIVSVYPYQEGTKITEDEVITLTLPAEQSYAESSFGLGANTMVSVTENNLLKYKNVGGYLVVKLYGEGVSVSSITLKGNNGEKLAGKGSVRMPLDGVPSVEMANDATTEITLTCPTPVQLGATAEESTEFWFVVPPVTFEKGFTIVAKTTRGPSVRSTNKSLTIERNNLSRMASFEVDYSQPNNVLYYTSTDGQVIVPTSTWFFGVNIVFNDYIAGTGIIVFDGDITRIGDYSFRSCSTLLGITVPSCVTSIGTYAFQGCSSLSGVSLLNGLISIEERAFCDCTSLSYISLPSTLTSIGDSAFSGCNSLRFLTTPASLTSIGSFAFSDCENLKYVTLSEGLSVIGDSAFSYCSNINNITLPNSLTSIGSCAFYWCKGLESILIPDSVTSIGSSAFAICTSLSSVTLSKGLTTIDESVFYYCTALSDITIPDSVTSIGNYAFEYCCYGLTEITIPESVTSIGESAFNNCSYLAIMFVLPQTPPAGGARMLDASDNCTIFVPAGSVDAYKSAPYWSDYSDRIRAIDAPEEVDGAVDMGLSVKWASSNLGASKPEEYGDYYAWGETETHYYSLDPLVWKEGNKEVGYGWENYKWCMGETSTLTKYCYDSSCGYNGFTDDKTVLDLEDDAANVNLGGHWRIPTDAEWNELIENSACTWTQNNGVSGMKITSKKNANSIFLPASGSFNYDYHYNPGINGFYWTSSLRENYAHFAWGVQLSNNVIRITDFLRHEGLAVRPVYAE